MTSHDSNGPWTDDMIVCAIGEGGSPAALRVAAAEAERTGSRLHLVHVSGEPHSHRSDVLLLQATAAVHATRPAVLVACDSVDSQWIAAGLASTSRRAHLVVVQQTHRGSVHRFLSGSTTDGVALKVRAAVLCVPADWDDHEPRPAVVTVAVQDADEVPALVALAATEATTRGADLVVLHAVTHHRDPADRSDDALHDWLDHAHLQLDGPVHDAVAGHPDLKVRLDVTCDRPVDAVVRASSVSELVVIGRRQHDHAWGTHLGPVVRHALLDAECPVLLAPESDGSAVVDGTWQDLQDQADEQAAALAPAPGDVLVAVGEDDASGSVRFAVAEAASRGVGVHLTHVVRMPAVDGVAAAEVWRDAVAHGGLLLERATVLARATGDPDLRVTSRLLEHGTLVRALVAEGAAAGAIVIQHRRLGTPRRWVTWSVTNGVAARTDVPVIAVPAEWATGTERIGCVVVGLQDLGDVEQVLPVAFDEAARRGLPLRVVHAGQPSSRAAQALIAATDVLHRGRPEVSLHRVFEDHDAVDLLVGSVSTAEIVVVGRRRHTLSRRSHLGPVARAVLEESPFPVLLAPPV